MKYNLINKQTGEEHLCDKVTIDGFDYYVSDKCNDLGGWHIDKEFEILSNVSRFNVVTEMREVIATTNPNIGVPKVVDEVEILGEDETNIRILQHKTPSRIARQYFDGFVNGYNKSQETHPFSEEDMIEFHKWAFQQVRVKESDLTTKELLQLWKEQQPKIVYYG